MMNLLVNGLFIQDIKPDSGLLKSFYNKDLAQKAVDT